MPHRNDTSLLLWPLTQGSIFYGVVKRPAEEVLCLETERGIERNVTDFYGCPLEKGDLVLNEQGPVGGRTWHPGHQPDRGEREGSHFCCAAKSWGLKAWFLERWNDGLLSLVSAIFLFCSAFWWWWGWCVFFLKPWEGTHRKKGRSLVNLMICCTMNVFTSA